MIAVKLLLTELNVYQFLSFGFQIFSNGNLEPMLAGFSQVQISKPDPTVRYGRRPTIRPTPDKVGFLPTLDSDPVQEKPRWDSIVNSLMFIIMQMILL
jgi:hypothetical protein